jgi:hypothetical protein
MIERSSSVISSDSNAASVPTSSESSTLGFRALSV